MSTSAKPNNTKTVVLRAKPDWTAVRLGYVHSSKTMADVSVEFGVTREAVMKRAEREGWTALRHQASESVSRAAAAQFEESRADALSVWNAADTRVATALRAQVAASINAAITSAKGPLSPSSIRALAGAAEAVQRIGRLALGASTDNVGLAGQNGEGPVALANVPVEEYEAALKRLLSTI